MAAIAFKTLGGSGPDVVLIHGFGSDRLSWLGNSPALLPFARVHALDLPGHGESDTDAGDGTPEFLARGVADALAAHGIGKAHLVGHSLGGGIALLLAASAPERVASLSLIAPAGLGIGIDAGFLAAYAGLADAESAVALLRRLVVKPLLINKMTVQRVLAQLAREGARDALKSIATQLVAHQAELAAAATRVAGYGTPRLVIWGANDSINPIDAARVGAFGGNLLNVADSAHLPHIENPRPVNEQLVCFLQEQAPD